MTFFREVIFPPIMRKVKSGGRTFQYWFLEETEWSRALQRKITDTKLMVTCPICQTDFCLKDFVPNVEMMCHALKQNFTFYYEHVLLNCPKSDVRHRDGKEYDEDWYKGYC